MSDLSDKSRAAFGEQAVPITQQLNDARPKPRPSIQRVAPTKRPPIVRQSTRPMLSNMPDPRGDIDLANQGVDQDGIKVPPFRQNNPQQDVQPERIVVGVNPEQATNYVPHANRVLNKTEVVDTNVYPREEDDPSSNEYADNSQWERIDLPSKFVPYEFKAMNVRKFNVDDLEKLARAISHDNTTLLFDCLDATIDQPLRTLTTPDLRYLMYWHRLHSYPRTEFKVSWESKYGNKNTLNISQTPLKITMLAMDPMEYQQWLEKGIAVPTAKDQEFLDNNKLNETELFLFLRGQYVSPNDPIVIELTAKYKAKNHPYPNIKARMDAIRQKGVDFLEDIKEFREKMDFGVEELLRIRDAHFDVDAHLNSIQENVERLRKTSSEEFLQMADLLQTEYDTLKARLDAGELVEADIEEVRVSFNPLSLFPTI